MSPTLAADAALDLSSVQFDVGTTLTSFLDDKGQDAPGPETAPLLGALNDCLVGGKRLRPQLCVAGWHAGGAHGGKKAVLRTAAALELFHAFALIHDDVMDASDIRRGQPSAHRALSAAYTAGGGWRSRAEAHGMGAAVLLGDLALVWSDELLHSAGIGSGRLKKVWMLVSAMRSELVYGQYLDLWATGRLSDDVEAALRVVRYKTAKYTVERPLQIGAVLAGAGPDVLEACSSFAVPLGEAYQLRDDLLGVFGEVAETGKPVGDDLREGKATVLMALAVQRASAADMRVLGTLVGNPGLTQEDILRTRIILEATGARQRVEEMISDRRDAALAALDQAALPPGVTGALREIARIATARRA